MTLRRIITTLSIPALALFAAAPASAQENPYFITYTHHMEEPGSLEIALNPVFGVPKGGARQFEASSLEIEYGVNGWWTSELYLDSQKTSGESALFTGYRFENRFRLLMKEHAVNPVLYVEYEDITGADKIFKEVVGFDSFRGLLEPAEDLRHEKKREVEAKLILSSNTHGWNLAGNLIAEKNLNGDPVEFGYAAAVSRPLAMAASPLPCSLCPENFTLGLELYGGLGEQHQVTLSGTSHYIAPSVAWSLPNGVTFRFSPSFGINGQQQPSTHTVRRGLRVPRDRVEDEYTMKPNQSVLVAFALLIGSAGCTAVPRNAAPLTAEHVSTDVMAGRKLFSQHCAACHGTEAEGTTRAPSLNTPSVRTMDDKALVQFLTDGDLRRGMPSWSRLPEERRLQLTRYLKSLPR